MTTFTIISPGTQPNQILDSPTIQLVWASGSRTGALVQFSSVAQSCPTLCDPMDCSTPGFPVHHQLPESTQTHVHWVGDVIQPSHPLPSPSPPAFNLSHHQKLSKVELRLPYGSFLVAQWLGFWAFTAMAWVHSWSGNWDPASHVVHPEKKERRPPQHFFKNYHYLSTKQYIPGTTLSAKDTVRIRKLECQHSPFFGSSHHS